MIQTRLSEPEDKVAAEERATLTKLQEELYSVEVSAHVLRVNSPGTDDDWINVIWRQDGFETPAADLEGLAIEDDLQGEQLLDEQSLSQTQAGVRHDEDETFWVTRNPPMETAFNDMHDISLSRWRSLGSAWRTKLWMGAPLT
jgi:hypothetical protein